jgi:branched-chain amino acid transport system permease protein
MSLLLLLQSFVNGITVGSLYGLTAVGLALIFGVMKILNVAHGEFIMIGSYIGFWIFRLYGIDPFLGIPIVTAALFLLGLICYKIFFSRVGKYMEKLKLENSLLIAFGLYLIFPQIAQVLWTGDERAISPSYCGESLSLLGIRVGYVPMFGFVVAGIVILFLHLLLMKTYYGKAVRATSENWKAAKLMGINVDRTYMLTFALGVAIAGIAGVLIGLTQALMPSMGMEWTIKALIVVLLAGVGSIAGAFFAGIILGIIEAVSAIWMGPYTVAVGMIILILILMFRPQGLFGRG